MADEEIEEKRIEKFGLQVAKAKRIWVFRNGDKFDEGKQIVLNEKRIPDFDQLKKVLSKEVKLTTGPVLKVCHASDGKKVASLDDFEDLHNYVACGGEDLDSDRIPKAARISPEDREKAEMGELEDDMADAHISTPAYVPKEKKEIKKFGMQVDKARVIYVFRNGDKNDKGTQIVMNMKLIPNYEKLKAHMTTECKVFTGAVKKVYDRHYKLVKSIDDFIDGENYVACGAEGIDKVKISKYLKKVKGEPEEESDHEGAADDTPSKPLHEYKPVVQKKEMKKFGMQVDKARVIHVFRNGDKNDKGTQIVMNMKLIPNYEKLKAHMTKECKVLTGAVKKVYDRHYKLVKSIDDFIDGENYVATGAEGIDKVKVSKHLKKVKGEPEEESDHEGAADDTPSKPLHEYKPVVQKKEMKKFGMQVDKARVIHVFRNGDKNDKGTQIVMNMKLIPNYEKLKAHMTKECKVSTGAVKKVYDRHYKLVKSIDDFIDGENYVATGAEGIDKVKISKHLKKLKGEPEEESDHEGAADDTPSKPLHEYKPVVQKKEMKKFGMQVDKARVIHVFRNGDKNDKGTQIVMNMKLIPNYEKLKAHMTKECKVSTGAVKKVYDRHYKLVKSIDDFIDGENYVATGAEGIDKVKVSKHLKKVKGEPEEESDHEGAADDTPSKPLHEYKPVVQKKEMKKFGMQVDKARVIHVFRNGDKNDKGTQIVMNMKLIPNYEKLKAHMTTECKVSTGAVKKVYDRHYKLVKSIDDFIDGENYVATGAEGIDKVKVSKYLKK